MKRLLAFVNSLCTICEFFVQHNVSPQSQVRPVCTPYSITKAFSCTSSLLELWFPCTSLLFQDLNSHRTMLEGWLFRGLASHRIIFQGVASHQINFQGLAGHRTNFQGLDSQRTILMKEFEYELSKLRSYRFEIAPPNLRGLGPAPAPIVPICLATCFGCFTSSSSNALTTQTVGITGHIFMYSAIFPSRVVGGCTVHHHRSVFLYFNIMLELWFPWTG